MKLLAVRYLTLLIVIIVMMVMSPFVQRAPYLRMLNNVVASLVLLSVVYTVKRHKSVFIVGLCLGIPWVLLSWLFLFYPESINPAILAATSMIFEGYVVYVILRHIIRAKKVTADIIYGAVSVYILLGVFFTSLYLFLDTIALSPLFSYGGTAPGEIYREGESLFYFSFVTLTTLGYGDIRPIADITRIFAIIEAMTGVLYAAALIGRLMGLYVAQSSKSGAVAQAASKAAVAASAAADAVIAEDSGQAAAAAAVASKAAADATVAAEAASSDSANDDDDEDDDENGNDDGENDDKNKDDKEKDKDGNDKDSKDPDTNR